MSAFLQRVAAAIKSHRMAAPGETVLAAFSGGPDSTALLHALWRLRGRLECKLCACHVHHGLRGEEADLDARHAAEFAASLGVPFVEKRGDVRAAARARKLSLETAAREVRYALLEEAAEAVGAQRIATGHTADDQAETVVMNLLRGAGPAGLSGMPAVRGKVVRPLLGLSRAEVAAYCAAEGLGYRVDRSNAEMEFTRNRIRHEVMPALLKVQPSAVEALCRLAEIMRAENELAAEAAEEALGQVATQRRSGSTASSLGLSLAAFGQLPEALRRRVLRAAIARVKGDERDLVLERIEALMELAEAGRAGSVVELPGGVRAERRYGEVLIGRGRRGAAAPTGEWPLPVPGEARTGLGWTISAALSEDLSVPEEQCSEGPYAAALDAEEAGEELVVRARRRGDRFTPLGMREACKLQDFLVNAKAPRAERARIPLVVSRKRGEIVWVVGYRIGDHCKVTGRTRRTIRLEARRFGDEGESDGDLV